MRQKPPLFGILMIAALGLAACGPIQAEEGQIYVAGEKATVTTVVDMARLEECSVPEGALAFAERKTYFVIINGSQERVRISLTEVAHTGEGCSPSGGYDFIEGKPKNAGWTLIDNPVVLKKATGLLCADSDLRELNPELNSACDNWGRTR